MIQEFYYGSSWHWPLPYLPRVMLSYNYIRTIKKPWRVDIPLMLDSGAYSVILKYGKYPYSSEDYSKGIEKWHPHIAWTMDYPCEPSVQKRGDYNPKKAQEMTIDNQIRLLDLNADTQMEDRLQRSPPNCPATLLADLTHRHTCSFHILLFALQDFYVGKCRLSRQHLLEVKHPEPVCPPSALVLIRLEVLWF